MLLCLSFISGLARYVLPSSDPLSLEEYTMSRIENPCQKSVSKETKHDTGSHGNSP